MDRFFDRIIAFFTSLRLTVVLLGCGLLLVFFGTLAQVDLGLYRVQNEFFRSFLVYWGPSGASWKMPVLPGGYLVGGLLLINLIAAGLKRYSFAFNKTGIWLIHGGLVLLLLGQLLTDFLSVESTMQFAEGETRNFSESTRACELVVTDKTDPQFDLIYAIGENKLKTGHAVEDQRLPFVVQVEKFWPNLELIPPMSKTVPPNATKIGATDGMLKDILVVPRPIVTDMDSRNLPGALVQIHDAKGATGKFLVSVLAMGPDEFELGGRRYSVELRFRRYYYPFAITLLNATHEKYRGTEIPKNFASRVRVENPQNNEARETVIYMNNPLRYSGLTFYQYQMAAGDPTQIKGKASSTLQVVRNPGWLTPYLACVMVAAGLCWQFGMHLFGFVKRKSA